MKMKSILAATLAVTTALAGMLPAGGAMAQSFHHDRGNRGGDRWDRDARSYRDRGGYHFYGGNYGYGGYGGRWRTGQRFDNWRDRRYYVDDWGSYHLPPPRPGYRYYRDDSGDIVMAAVASGMIGLIVGGALNR